MILIHSSFRNGGLGTVTATDFNAMGAFLATSLVVENGQRPEVRNEKDFFLNLISTLSTKQEKLSIIVDIFNTINPS